MTDMARFVDRPALMFVVLLVLLVGAVVFGALVLRRLIVLPDEERDDFNIVQTSMLTLLALLIGFSLSMAVSRYDARKNLEENEANAIGTEYARADLAAAPVSAHMKDALLRYTRLRLDHFLTREPQAIADNEHKTADVQAELWQLATQIARENPTPISAVIVTGMNDVLNSQDYSEAALINRIPTGAWVLMLVIATFGCAVQGYGAKGRLRRGLFVIILPMTVALSLAFIADIDSPRGGFIHVQPQNLSRLLQALQK